MNKGSQLFLAGYAAAGQWRAEMTGLSAPIPTGNMSAWFQRKHHPRARGRRPPNKRFVARAEGFVPWRTGVTNCQGAAVDAGSLHATERRPSARSALHRAAPQAASDQTFDPVEAERIRGGSGCPLQDAAASWRLVRSGARRLVLTQTSTAAPLAVWVTPVLHGTKPSAGARRTLIGVACDTPRGDASVGTSRHITRGNRARQSVISHATWPARRISSEEKLTSPYFIGLGTRSAGRSRPNSYEDFMGVFPDFGGRKPALARENALAADLKPREPQNRSLATTEGRKCGRGDRNGNCRQSPPGPCRALSVTVYDRRNSAPAATAYRHHRLDEPGLRSISASSSTTN